MPLMDNGVQVDITAKNDASPVIKQVAADINGLEQSTDGAAKADADQTSGVVSLNAALQVAETTVRAVGKAYQFTVGETQKYDQTILDVMISTGGTAEEASRLVNVIDDVGISYGTLKTAMKMASKEGIEPNIESLIELSDQYLKLAPGVERNQFLLDKFGRSGMDMARALEMGGDRLREMNEAIGDGLVITQDAIDESEEYRINLDKVSDSILGVKVAAGNELLPVLNDLFESNERVNDSMRDGDSLWQARIRAAQEMSVGVDSATQSYIAMAESMKGITAVEGEIVLIDADAVKGAMAVHDAYDKMNDKIADLQIDQDILLAKKQELIDQGWGPESEKIQDVNDKLDDNVQKQKDVVIAMQGTIGQMILNTAAAGLDAEGQLALARATGQIDEPTYAALTAIQLLKEQQMEGTLKSSDYAVGVLAVRDAVARLESKGIVVTLDAILNEYHNTIYTYTEQLMGNRGNQRYGGEQYASGTEGWQSVPAGYPNDSYPIMLSSGERFAVIPEGVSASPSGGGGGWGGGGVTLNVFYAPGISFGDEAEFKEKIAPLMLEVVQDYKANGQI